MMQHTECVGNETQQDALFQGTLYQLHEDMSGNGDKTARYS